MSFQLPDLTYNHDALEPHIDSKTMQIHHSKHHAGYTSKLNAAIEGTELANKSIEEILTTLDMSNSAVRNNADSDGSLEVCSTANQDNPLMPGECGKTPILGLDVWEHAYYLNYQNRRPDYVNAFFNIINWDAVTAKYKEAMN